MEVLNSCAHYIRNCHVEAPCCKIFYPCKLCHDELFQFKKGCQTQRMEFEKVERVKCLQCNEVQQPALKCQKCEVQFGKYACLKCRLYESNADKVEDIHHCDSCRMCRRGTQQTLKHCFTCGYCVPISNKNHKCIENASQSQCPVCMELLHFSTKGYIDLKCGHLIHLECLEMLTNINCPVCGMAMQKLSKNQNKHIDKLISQTKDNLPEELKEKKVNVLCSECLHKTMDADFHYYGVKCEKCGTYNTKMM